MTINYNSVFSQARAELDAEEYALAVMSAKALLRQRRPSYPVRLLRAFLKALKGTQ